MSLTSPHRKAQIDDLPKILSCFEAAIISIDVRVYSAEQKKAWIRKGFSNAAKWTERLENQHFLVSEIDNRIIAFASVSNAGYVDLLFTHPDYQRKGIASQLYTQLEQYALKRQICLLTTHASAISVDFFKAKGFELIAENNFDLYEVPISNFHLKKALD